MQSREENPWRVRDSVRLLVVGFGGKAEEGDGAWAFWMWYCRWLLGDSYRNHVTGSGVRVGVGRDPCGHWRMWLAPGLYRETEAVLVWLCLRVSGFAEDIDVLFDEEQEVEALVESFDKTCTRYKMEISV